MMLWNLCVVKVQYFRVNLVNSSNGISACLSEQTKVKEIIRKKLVIIKYLYTELIK